MINELFGRAGMQRLGSFPLTPARKIRPMARVRREARASRSVSHGPSAPTHLVHRATPTDMWARRPRDQPAGSRNQPHPLRYAAPAARRNSPRAAGVGTVASPLAGGAGHRSVRQLRDGSVRRRQRPEAVGLPH